MRIWPVLLVGYSDSKSFSFWILRYPKTWFLVSLTLPCNQRSYQPMRCLCMYWKECHGSGLVAMSATYSFVESRKV
jgi:hypothetical protein